MKAPNFWFNSNDVQKKWYWPVLKGLSQVYLWLYQQRQNNANPYTADIPIICVGNIIAGGAGKTPTALALHKILSKKYANIAFLSRGYGGDLEGPVFVDLNIHRSKDVGDEPLLLAQHGRTIVSKDKVEGVRYAERNDIDCLILDDGFQNPSLKKKLHILVIDGRGFGYEHLLPAGPLREPIKDALEKTDIVIATDKLPQNVKDHLKANWLPIFRGGYKTSVTTPEDPRVFGFAGIGHPEKFKKTLEEHGYEVVGFMGFPDHHTYSQADMQRLTTKANGAQLITTEKDATKIASEWSKKIETLPISLEFEPEKQQELEQWLDQHLS